MNGGNAGDAGHAGHANGRPASSGRLAVLTPGFGAVATTLMAGVDLIRRGQGNPVGSMAEMGLIDHQGTQRKVRDLVPLAGLDNLVFGAWDIRNETGEEVLARSNVLSEREIGAVAESVGCIAPKPGVFNEEAVRRIEANHVLKSTHHKESIEALRQDIRDFKRDLGADRAVVVHCASTETHRPQASFAGSLRDLDRAIERNAPEVFPTVLYAYAAIEEGVPFVNGTPNGSVDLPAIQQLAADRHVPICGKDFKSGQTLIKTVLAPALRARVLGLNGWYSTNLLGNRDGEVLDDPDAFRSKEVTKMGVLETILDGQEQQDLYGEFANRVTIHYYPPRGDEKEGWDNIDLFGWLNYPMQIKVNFLCRDSILAAPLALDLALFADLAARAGAAGVQDWLSFYFKSPAVVGNGRPVHDLFAQLGMLEQTLCELSEHSFAAELA